MSGKDDPRYQFIFDTVSKYSTNSDSLWQTLLDSGELSKFCDDSSTTLLSCNVGEKGKVSYQDTI